MTEKTKNEESEYATWANYRNIWRSDCANTGFDFEEWVNRRSIWVKIPTVNHTWLQPLADPEALPHVVGVEIAGQSHPGAVGWNTSEQEQQLANCSDMVDHEVKQASAFRIVSVLNLERVRFLQYWTISLNLGLIKDPKENPTEQKTNKNKKLKKLSYKNLTNFKGFLLCSECFNRHNGPKNLLLRKQNQATWLRYTPPCRNRNLKLTLNFFFGGGIKWSQATRQNALRYYPANPANINLGRKSKLSSNDIGSD
jgi:hypothetical protein